MNYKSKKVKIFTILFILLSLTTAVQAENVPQINQTGSGIPGFKDGKVSEASFYFPYGITLDAEGNLIVVDSYNNRIRKIEGETVKTLAGSIEKEDSFGFPKGKYADGDPSVSGFNRPRDAAVNSKGEVFIADSGNNAIRKISGGKVYTFAGNGEAGYVDGNGIKARFNNPTGLAIDREDNIYIADCRNNVIRKITPNGEVSTYAGTKTSEGGYANGDAKESMFNEPSDVVIDKDGDIYVADSGNQCIRKISGQKVTTIAGTRGEIIGGTNYYKGGYEDGLTAKFNFPKGLAITGEGVLFVADSKNNRIRAVLPNGRTVTVAGNGTAGKYTADTQELMLNNPVSMVYSSGTLHVSDMWNNYIISLKVDLDEIQKAPSREKMIAGIEFDEYSDKVQVWVNKKKVDFPDVQPFENEGKTYVPLRFICEMWGAKVSWIEAENKVAITKGDFVKEFELNNGPVKELNGRSIVHLRALAESMGFYVDWVDEYNAAIVSTN